MIQASRPSAITRLGAVRYLLKPDTYSALPEKFDVLLLCHDNDRAVEVAGRAYAQVVDSAGDRLADRGYSVASVAARLSRLTGERAHRNPVAINRGAILAMALDRIEEALGPRTGEPRRRRRSNEFWRRLLTAHRPRVVLGIGLPRALCSATKGLGVTTIETMHGFGLPPDDWVHGVEARSRVGENEEPDLYIVYDKVTFETIRLGSRGKKTGVVLARPPFLELATNSDDLPPFLAPLHRARRLHQPYERVVLMTLQHGYDGQRSFLAGIVPNGILHPQIEQAIRGDPSTLWLLKLHPVQLRGAARDRIFEFMGTLAAQCANVEWEETSNTALVQLLQVVDAHVTMSSGTVYEAAMCGVQSVAFCPTVRPGGYLQTYFEDLVAAQWVTKDVTDAASLRRWLVQAAKQRLAGSNASLAELETLPTTADVVEQVLRSGRT